eukprot:7732606-Pyramimonas_sp.AAC.1
MLWILSVKLWIWSVKLWVLSARLRIVSDMRKVGVARGAGGVIVGPDANDFHADERGLRPRRACATATTVC